VNRTCFRGSLALAGFACFGTAIASPDPHTLAECRAIQADAERLACYDRLAPDPAAAAGVPTAEAGAMAAPAAPAREPAGEARDEKVAETAANRAPEESASDFGLEMQNAAERSSMRSRIDGEFRGWSGGTVFRLKNGQVWRQVGSDRLGYYAVDPEVEIERGAMGSFLMRVESLNKRVRVRRIE
jgi:hypothetical protein